MSVLATAEVYMKASNYSGSGNWLDESGNGHNAQPIGSPTFNGESFTLDGSTQWFVIPDDDNLDFALSDSFTVIVVAATDSLTPSGSKNLFGKLTGGVGYQGLQFNAQDYFACYIDDGTNNPFDVKTGAFTGTGVQTVCAMRRDVSADELEAFADGVSSGSPASDTTTGTLANATGLFIGAQATSVQAWDGEIYAFALWRSALTDTQIAAAGAELTTSPNLTLLGVG